MTDLINKIRVNVYDIENKISDLENLIPCYDIPSGPEKDELKSSYHI